MSDMKSKINYEINLNGERSAAFKVSLQKNLISESLLEPVLYQGADLAGARVYKDQAELARIIRSSSVQVEKIEIPAGKARDAFLKKWAKAAEKNKNGLIPLLLLPLAACGGGGGETVLESYEGTIASATALTTSDLIKYSSSFSITVSDGPSVSAADLTAVADKTSGDVMSLNVTELTGSAEDVKLALENAQLVNLDAANVVITQPHNLTDLKAINVATTGNITFDASGGNSGNASFDLSGISADLAAALDGLLTYSGAVTLSDAHTLAELKVINNGTSGAITLSDVSVDLIGEAADILAALTEISGYSGNITITDAANAADIEAIAQLTTGTLTSTLKAGEITLDLSSASSKNVITVTDDANVTGSDQADKLIVQDGTNSDVDLVVDLGGGADEVRVENGAILASEGDSIVISDTGDVSDTDTLTVSGTNNFDVNSSWTDIEALEIESSISFTAKQINAVNGNIKVADSVKDDGGEHKVTIAAVTADDLEPGETLEEANAVSLSSLEGVTSIAVDKGIAAQVELQAAKDLAATKTKYAANTNVETGIEVEVDEADPTVAGVIVVSPEAKNELEQSVNVKIGGVQVDTIPYGISDTFAGIEADVGQDANWVANAIVVVVEDKQSLTNLNGAMLADAKSLQFKGGIEDAYSNLVDAGVVSDALTTALASDPNSDVTVNASTTLNVTQANILADVLSSKAGLKATVDGLSADLVTLKTEKLYDDISITLTNATGTDVSATNLSLIADATSSTVAISNAIDVTGSISDVQSLQGLSKVILPSDYTVELSDAGSVTVTDLSDIAGKTTGAIVVTNAITTSGTADQVKAAFEASPTKVDVSVSAAVTVSDATDVATASAISNATNVTATFTSGVKDVFANLYTASTDLVSAELIEVLNDDADTKVEVTDATGSIGATGLSALNAYNSTGSVTLSGAATIAGSEAQLKKALITDGVVASGAKASVTDGVGTGIAASAISALADKVSSVEVSNAIDMTGSISDVQSLQGLSKVTLPSDYTVELSDAGSVTVTDLSEIAGKTTGAVVVTNAITTSGTADQVKAAFEASPTKVDVSVSAAVTVSDATDVATASAISNATNVTATFTSGVKDVFANLYTAGTDLVSAELIEVLNDDADTKVEVTDATGIVGATGLSALIAVNSTGSVTLSGAATIAGSEAQLKKALITDGVVASGAKASVTDGVGTGIAASAISALADKVSSVEVSNAIDMTGSISDVQSLQGLSKVTLPSDYTVELSDAGSVTVTDLSEIAGKTTGAVVVTNAITTSGTADQVKAAFEASPTKVDVSVSAAVTVSDATDVATASAISNATNVTATFTSGVKDVFANLYTAGTDLVSAELIEVLNDDADTKVEVTDATGIVGATGLSALIAVNSTGSVTLSGAATIAGSEAQLKKALITDGVVASGAKASVTDGVGTGIAASAISALADKVSSVEVSNAIDMTGSISDVQSLQGLSKVTLPSDYTVELSDAGSVTVTDLSEIAGKTTGAVVVTNAITTSGTADQVKAAFEASPTKVDVSVSAAVTVSDATDVATASAISNATNVTATFTSGVKDVFANLYTAGTDLVSAELIEVLNDDADTKVEVTDATGIVGATGLSALIAVNSTGSVTLSGAATIAGSEAQLKKALITDGVVASGAKASVTDGVGTGIAASAISALADKVSSVEVSNAIDVTGSISDVQSLQGLSKVTLPSDYTVELSDAGSVTVTDLSEIAGKTSGSFSMPNVTTLSGSAAELNALSSALDSLSFSTGDFKITGDGSLTLAALKSLNEKTSGSIDLNTSTQGADWSGASDDLVAALNGFSTLGGNVLVSDASSVAALKVIQSATSGSVSLQNEAFALTGNSTDIKLALSGIQSFKGAITVTDQGLTGSTGVNLLNEISALSSGVITASVSGTAFQLKSLATGSADSINIQLNSVVTLSDYNQISEKTGLSFTYSGATETAVTEDVVKTLTLDDFSFTGSNQNDISSIVVASVPRGSLILDGVSVSQGDEITSQQISDSLLTYQTLTNDAGDASFKFLVKEGGQSTENEVTLTLDVTAVDDQPVNTVPSQSIEVDEKTTEAINGISVSDVDNGTLVVTLSVDSGTLNVKTDVSGGLSAGSISQNGTGAVVLSGTKSAVNATLGHGQGLQFTPAIDDADTSVTLTTTTDSGAVGQDIDTITIFVKDVDEPPTVSVVSEANLTIQQGEALDIALLIQDDLNSSPNVTLTQKPTWVTATVTSNTITSAVTTNAEVGSHTIKLTVDDGAGNEVAKELSIEVENVNDAPIYSAPQAGDIQVAQHATLSLDLGGLFNDPDANSAAPTLNVTHMPDGATFNTSSGIFTWTPTAEKFVGDNATLNRVEIIATDDLNAETTSEFVITVSNTNDAPIASDKTIKAAVTEGVWSGSPIENTLQSLEMVIDPDGNASDLSVAISQETGVYGSLTYNEGTDTFVYTPVNDSVEALNEGETVEDNFSVIFTDAEGESSVSKTLSFELIGENDIPVVVAPNFEALDSGAQDVTVGVLTGTDDVDTNALTFQLTANVETDNVNFQIVNGNELILKSGVTTSSDASPYALEVVAVDSLGANSTPLSFALIVNSTDSAPTIVSVTADKTDADLGIGDVLTLTATASEAVKSNSGTVTFNITLSNNKTVIMTRSTNDATKFTGTYTVVEGDTASSDLSVLSYDAGNVIDTGTSANALNTSQGSFSLTNLTVDAIRPEATVSATGHTYDSSTGTLVLSGENFNTLGVSDGASVKSIVDWTKLTWNAVGGNTVPTEQLALSDINTALVDTAANTITVVLNSGTDIGSTVLHALTNFGNTGVGKVDTLTVAEGFLKDPVGNSSAQVDTTATIEMVDQTAPVVASVTAVTSTGAAIVGVGESITFTALMTDENAMKVGTSFTLGLSNGTTVTLDRTADTAVKEMVGVYTVAEGNTDSSDLTIVSMSASPSASDISGNVLVAATPSLTNTSAIGVKGTLSEATISATGHTYDSSTGTLVLSGEKFNTLGVSDGASVKSIVDWTKLTWNAVGGNTVPTEQLALSDINTALVDTAANTITVALNSGTDIGSTVLHALTNFGNTGVGKVDTLTVAEGFLKDIFGNASSAQVDTTATIEMVDQTAPVVASVTAVTSTGAAIVGVGESITFTALMTDENAMKVGTSFTLGLSNGTTVTLDRTADTAVKEMVGVYTVAEGNTDSSDLTIVSMSASPSASDISGNVLVAATPSLTNTSAIGVKGTLSEATISATGHTYDSSTGTLVLSGEKFNTLGVSDGASVKSIVDWTKLTWNAVGGNTVPTEQLALSDINTALVDTAANTITVVLNSGTDIGSTVLHALTNFGNTGVGKVDTLTVAEGFLKDIFGNASSAQVDTTATIEMVDQTAPVVASVTAVTSTGAAIVGVGESITFTALMTDENAMKVGTSFTLGLSNGTTVTLDRTADTAVKEMVGVYTVAEGNTDSSDLTIVSMSASPSASDISGNVLVAATPSYAQGQGTIEVDTTAPTTKLQSSGHSFDTINDTLTLSVNNIGTLGVSDGGSVKTQLDWSKLVWNAVGDAANSMTFSSADISTAVVNVDAETISIALTEGAGLGATKLYAFSSFGGVGGNIDSVQASAGFLNDVAGNASSEEAAVTTVDVNMSDTTAPVIKSITAAGPSGSNLVGAGDVVTFTAVMTDANAIKADTKFIINLDDGLGSVELTRTTGNGADELTGQYTVQAGDNSSGLSLSNYSVPNSESGARDISGNQLEGGLV